MNLIVKQAPKAKLINVLPTVGENDAMNLIVKQAPKAKLIMHKTRRWKTLQ